MFRVFKLIVLSAASGKERTATVVAMTFCEVYSLAAERLFEVVTAWPEIAALFHAMSGSATRLEKQADGTCTGFSKFATLVKEVNSLRTQDTTELKQVSAVLAHFGNPALEPSAQRHKKVVNVTASPHAVEHSSLSSKAQWRGRMGNSFTSRSPNSVSIPGQPKRDSFEVPDTTPELGVGAYQCCRFGRIIA